MSASPRILRKETLSHREYLLQAVTFTSGDNGAPQTHEVYDAGNAATILLYDPERRTVLLTRQFRLPALLNGHPDGQLTEACAGKLDNDGPEACIIREAREELGMELPAVQRVMELYMSPGAYTELLYFFVAPYSPAMKKTAGGGLAEEGESVQILELSFREVIAALRDGAIRDAKTVILLQHALLQGLIYEDTPRR